MMHCTGAKYSKIGLHSSKEPLCWSRLSPWKKETPITNQYQGLQIPNLYNLYQVCLTAQIHESKFIPGHASLAYFFFLGIAGASSSTISPMLRFTPPPSAPGLGCQWFWNVKIYLVQCNYWLSTLQSLLRVRTSVICAHCTCGVKANNSDTRFVKTFCVNDLLIIN